MFHQGGFFINFGKLILSFFWEILYFPIWWYSRGIFILLIRLKNFLAGREKKLALFIWIKNLGKPMYSIYTWEGIVISFFVRLFQIIVRGIIMLLWMACCVAVFLFWIILPLLVVYELYFQFEDLFLSGNIFLILNSY